MNMQVFFVFEASADVAHRESNHQATREDEHSRREQFCLHAELENRERALQETRMKTLEEI